MGSDLPLKILFIVPYVPTRIRTRPFHLIRALASEGHRVTLATLWSNRAEFAEARCLAEKLEGLVAEKIGLSRVIWNCIRALPTSHPIQADYSWSPKLARKIARIVEETPFDVVHVEHLRGVRYGLMLKETLARKGLKHPPVVWDSVDCISTLFRQAAQESCSTRSRLTTKIELSRTEQFEGWLATRFSRVLVTSETDRSELLKLAENWCRRHGIDPRPMLAKRLAIVPNGVDLEYFSPNGDVREPSTLVISGKMSYHANVTAVVRYVKDVMPKIWAALPETRLWIVGKDPSREIQKLGIPWREDQPSSTPKNGNRESRVQVTGTVDDIRPFLRRATLAVAPIRYGVGIQNKVLEGLACGTPVVATPQAVTALQVRSGQELMIAESQQELADSVLSLLKNPQHCSRLGRSGRLFVEQQHAWSSIVKGLTEIYRDARCQP